MTNKRSTKRALIASVISLMLCFTMLMGTTYAWFTDSVASTNNIIQSGNLDVELYWSTDNSTWEKVDSNTNVFTSTLWEPGHTEVVYLKVVNEGSLALKYQLGVNIASEVGSTNVYDKTFKLSEFIKYGVVATDTAFADRDKAVEALTTITALNTPYLSEVTKLGPVTKDASNNDVFDSDVVAMVVYMPTDVGNDANYKKDAAVPKINLGINLFATQVEAESDSFGDDYDKDAVLYEVRNATQLAAALAQGQSVKLMEDIELTETVNIPADAISTIDLNGNDINYTATSGSVIYSKGNLTIIGEGTIKTEAGAYGIRVQSGSLVIDSANIAVDSAFGAVSVFNGADVTINGGKYTNTGYNDNTSHVIYLGGYGTININGGTFDSGYSNGGIDTICGYGWSNAANQKAVINLNGGTFYPSELNGSYYFISNYDGAWTEININGGTYHKYDPKTIAGVKVNGTVTDNGDGSWNVALSKADFKELLEDFAASGETETEINFGGSEVNLSYGLSGDTVPAGTTVTIANANVTGSNYGNGVNGTVVFENCVFENASGAYSIHFDSGSGDVVFKNCKLLGWCSFGDAINSVTMENCTIGGNGIYGLCRFYQDATLTDCKIDCSNSKLDDVYADGISSVYGAVVTLTNCEVAYAEYEIYEATMIIDGAVLAVDNDTLKAAISNNAEVLILDGEYDMSTSASNVTFVGASEEGTKINYTIQHSGVSVGSIWRPTNFKNLTFTNTVFTMADGGESTFEDVTFAAGFRRGYGKGVEFTDCTFGSNSEGYALHFESDSSSEGGLIKLTDCEFEGGKVHLGGKRSYEFTNCDFATGTDLQAWGNITLDGCTVDGVAVTAENIGTLFANLNIAKVTLK